MGRNRAHHVVYLPTLHELQARNAYRPTDRADDHRPVVLDNVGPAVIATNPAIAPFSPASKSTRPRTGRDRPMATITPAAAARLVLARMLLTATASAAPLRASCEPPLKPNHPSHSMRRGKSEPPRTGKPPRTLI